MRALYAVALGTLLLLGLVCWFVVRPVLEVRAVLLDHYAGQATGGERAAIRRLGGRDAALGKLSLYLKLPARVAPHRDLAALLLGCDERAIPTLVRALNSGEKEVRWSAAVALGRIGPEARPALPDLVRQEEEADYAYAADLSLALIAIGPGTAREVPGLARLLSHSSAYVRSEAARQLGLIGPDAAPAVKELAGALTDSDAGVRSNAAEALGRIGPRAQETAGTLEKALADPGGAVRAEAALALWRITGRPEKAVPVLLGELERWAPREVPDYILEGLAEIGPPAAAAVPAIENRLTKEFVPDKNAGLEAYCLCRIAGVEGKGFQVLCRAAKDSSREQRLGAAEALGRLGPPARAAAPALKELLGDEDAEVRIAAAEALWRVTGEAGEPVRVLVGLFGQENEGYYLHRNAADTLGHMGPAAREAVPALAALIEKHCEADLDADDCDVLRAAAEALGKFGPGAREAEPALERLREHTYPFVRHAAAEALKKVRSEEASK